MKRTISIILAVMMLAGVMPLAVFADEPVELEAIYLTADEYLPVIGRSPDTTVRVSVEPKGVIEEYDFGTRWWKADNKEGTDAHVMSTTDVFESGYYYKLEINDIKSFQFVGELQTAQTDGKISFEGDYRDYFVFNWDKDAFVSAREAVTNWTLSMGRQIPEDGAYCDYGSGYFRAYAGDKQVYSGYCTFSWMEVDGGGNMLTPSSDHFEDGKVYSAVFNKSPFLDIDSEKYCFTDDVRGSVTYYNANFSNVLWSDDWRTFGPLEDLIQVTKVNYIYDLPKAGELPAKTVRIETEPAAALLQNEYGTDGWHWGTSADMAYTHDYDWADDKPFENGRYYFICDLDSPLQIAPGYHLEWSDVEYYDNGEFIDPSLDTEFLAHKTEGNNAPVKRIDLTFPEIKDGTDLTTLDINVVSDPPYSLKGALRSDGVDFVWMVNEYGSWDSGYRYPASSAQKGYYYAPGDHSLDEYYEEKYYGEDYFMLDSILADGYEITADTVVTLNGREIKEPDDWFVGPIGVTPIEEYEILIDEPAVGAAPASTMTARIAPQEALKPGWSCGVKWYKTPIISVKPPELIPLAEDEIFESGWYYIATPHDFFSPTTPEEEEALNPIASDDYAVTKDTVTKINGKVSNNLTGPLSSGSRTITEDLYYGCPYWNLGVNTVSRVELTMEIPAAGTPVSCEHDTDGDPISYTQEPAPSLTVADGAVGYFVDNTLTGGRIAADYVRIYKDSGLKMLIPVGPMEMIDDVLTCGNTYVAASILSSPGCDFSPDVEVTVNGVPVERSDIVGMYTYMIDDYTTAVATRLMIIAKVDIPHALDPSGLTKDTHGFNVCVCPVCGEKIALGDVNADGKVTVRDVAMMMRAQASWTQTGYDSTKQDYNADGKFNARDIALLMRDIASAK